METIYRANFPTSNFSHETILLFSIFTLDYDHQLPPPVLVYLANNSSLHQYNMEGILACYKKNEGEKWLMLYLLALWGRQLLAEGSSALSKNWNYEMILIRSQNIMSGNEEENADETITAMVHALYRIQNGSNTTLADFVFQATPLHRHPDPLYHAKLPIIGPSGLIILHVTRAMCMPLLCACLS